MTETETEPVQAKKFLLPTSGMPVRPKIFSPEDWPGSGIAMPDIFLLNKPEDELD